MMKFIFHIPSIFRSAVILTSIFSGSFAMEGVDQLSVTKNPTTKLNSSLHPNLSAQELLRKSKKGDLFSKNILLEKIVDGVVPDILLKTIDVPFLCNFSDMSYWEESADIIVAAYFIIAKAQTLPILPTLFSLVEKRAIQGNPLAQRNLGWMYQEGCGVSSKNQKENDVIAMSWYEKSAKQGNARAQLALGDMYREGRGGLSKNQKKNDVIAVNWYEKSAKQGNPQAQFSLGVMCELNRGVLFKNKKAYDKNAVKWYAMAAEQGHAIAQNNLGIFYKEGRGVTSKNQCLNDSIAEGLFRRSAKHGDVMAQFNLAMMYRENRSILSHDDPLLNNEMAEKWLTKAARQGHPIAQCNLGAMYACGLAGSSNTQRENDKKAIKYFSKAALQGNFIAQFNLAMLYKKGRGVRDIDSKMALQGVVNAALKGFNPAKEELCTYFELRPYKSTKTFSLQMIHQCQDLNDQLQKMRHSYEFLGNVNQSSSHQSSSFYKGLNYLRRQARGANDLVQVYLDIFKIIEDPCFMLTCLKQTHPSPSMCSFEYSLFQMENRYICLKPFSIEILWRDSLKNRIAKVQQELDKVYDHTNLLNNSFMDEKTIILDSFVTTVDSKNKCFYLNVAEKMKISSSPNGISAHLQALLKDLDQRRQEIHKFDGFVERLNTRFHILIQQTADYRNTLFMRKISR